MTITGYPRPASKSTGTATVTSACVTGAVPPRPAICRSSCGNSTLNSLKPPGLSPVPAETAAKRSAAGKARKRKVRATGISRRTRKKQDLPAEETGLRLQRQSVTGCIALPACFEQEPGPALGLVDTDLDPARRCDVAVLVAHVVYLAQPRGERLVVIAQFSEHIQRLDIRRIVFQQAPPPSEG